MELYWITLIGNIHAALTIIVVLLGSTILAAYFLWFCTLDNVDYTKGNKAMASFVKKALILWSICFGLLIFVPSSKELYLMYGLNTTSKSVKISNKCLNNE